MGNKIFINENVVIKAYMIEADDDAGEFVESEDGVMVNLFWSNDDGWVPPPMGETFSTKDFFTMDLPMGGHWVEATTVMNVSMYKGGYCSNQVTNIERNFTVYPDEYEDENNFRIV